MPANRNVTELETYAGEYVDFYNPRPDQIHIEDIAAGLANTCRFAGQVTRYYSVAEHSVRVAEIVPEHLRLAALHHDSHEAYTGDIIAPLKAVLEREAPGIIVAVQDRLDAVIGIALGIDPISMHCAEVKMADDYMMYREAAALKYSHGIGIHWGNDRKHTPMAGLGWSPAKAERMFLEAHERYAA